MLWGIFLFHADDAIVKSIYLPIGIDYVRYYDNVGEQAWCQAAIVSDDASLKDGFTADFRLLCVTPPTTSPSKSEGCICGASFGKRCYRKAPQRKTPAFMEIRWKPEPLPPARPVQTDGAFACPRALAHFRRPQRRRARPGPAA